MKNQGGWILSALLFIVVVVLGIQVDNIKEDKDIAVELLSMVIKDEGVYTEAITCLINKEVIANEQEYCLKLSDKVGLLTEGRYKSYPNSKLAKYVIKNNNSNKECIIKGNISIDGEKIYHIPGCDYYNNTSIDSNYGERWFCSEEQARNAGWRKAKNC